MGPIGNLVPPRPPDNHSERDPEEATDEPTEVTQEFFGDGDLFFFLSWKDDLYNCLGDEGQCERFALTTEAMPDE